MAMFSIGILIRVSEFVRCIFVVGLCPVSRTKLSRIRNIVPIAAKVIKNILGDQRAASRPRDGWSLDEGLLCRRFFRVFLYQERGRMIGFLNGFATGPALRGKHDPEA